MDRRTSDLTKAQRYGELGVREKWRLHGIRNSWQFQVEFLALDCGGALRTLDASEVLEGLTSDDVREAADGCAEA